MPWTTSSSSSIASSTGATPPPGRNPTACPFAAARALSAILLIGRPRLADEWGEVWGTGRFPTFSRRGLVGETLSPRTRPKFLRSARTTLICLSIHPSCGGEGGSWGQRCPPRTRAEGESFSSRHDCRRARHPVVDDPARLIALAEPLEL